MPITLADECSSTPTQAFEEADGTFAFPLEKGPASLLSGFSWTRLSLLTRAEEFKQSLQNGSLPAKSGLHIHLNGLLRN